MSLPTSAWPPSPTATYVQSQGLTTIVWGTSGILGNDGQSGAYIVKSAKFSERNEEVDVENGSGLEAVAFLILKGHDVDISVVEDTGVTPPTSGGVVSLVTPYGSYAFWVVNTDVEAARKAEGTRVLKLKNFNAFTVA